MKKTVYLLIIAIIAPLCLLSSGSFGLSSIPATDEVRKSMEKSEESTSTIDRILPPTPQSANLARYGEHPVDLSTGLVDISVPIYNITVGEFQLPVSLSYHASGIRVSDIATPVGLGWVLNAGGAISRTIISKPDPVVYDANDPNLDKYLHYRDYSAVDSLVKKAQNLEMLEKLAHPSTEIPEYDLEADRFTFNFCGHSGVMRYDHKNNEYVPLNYENLKIEAFYIDSKTAFRVIDSNGLEYIFADHECTGYSADGTPPVTSWYLSEIHTPWGKVSFSYAATNRYFVDNYSLTGFVGEHFELDPSGDEKITYEAKQNSGLIKVSTYYNEILLKKIEWDGHSVEFNYSADRKVRVSSDNPVTLSRLTSIKVKDSENESVLSATLTHKEWGSNDENRRTLLSSVKLSNEGTYGFKYLTDGGYLPSYTSSGDKDYWGYYNGGSPALIPKETYDSVIKIWNQIYPEKNITKTGPPGGNLNPDASKMQYGVLKSIDYPTGGYSTFEYEPHSDDRGEMYGGLRIKSIITSADHDSPSIRRSFSYDGSAVTLHPKNFMFHLVYEPHTLPSGAIKTCHFVINSSPYSFMTSGMSCPLKYGCVVETQGSRKTVTNFTRAFLEDEFLLYRTVGFTDKSVPFLHCDLIPGAAYDEGNSPMLIASKSISENDNVLYSEAFEYSGFAVRTFNAGVKLVKAHPFTASFWGESKSSLLTRAYIGYQPVRCVAKTFCNVEKTVVDHTTGFSTVEYMDYDSIRWRTLKPRSVRTLLSDGRMQTTTFEYVADRADSHSKRLSDVFMNDDAIRGVVTDIDGTVVSRSRIDYAEFHLGQNLSDTWVLPAVTYSAFGNDELTERERIISFNNHGRPLAVITEQTDTSRFEWKNGIYLARYIAPGGLNSTYSFKPLVGLKSTTDQRGYTVSYSYHSDGRLATVYDYRGTIKSYDYKIRSRDASPDNSITQSVRLSDSPDRYVTTVNYFDGLGRPVVTADNSSSPALKYSYTMQSYDSYGRVVRTTLPAVGGVSPEMPSVASMYDMLASTYENDSVSWSNIRHDGLDRVISESTPGNEWTALGKGCRTDYLTNNRNDVKLYTAPIGSTSLVKSGYYPANTLQGERTTDEDGNSVTVFKDRQGKKVLERRGRNNDTYYVYNDFGQLRFILSPEYQNSGYKDKYAYEFRYDSYGRMVKEIIPGSEATQMWYDRAGRTLFVQSPRLAEKGMHRFMLYDAAGRPCVQGTTMRSNRSSAVNPVSMSSDLANLGGYVMADPSRLDVKRLESVSYYDNYAFLSLYNRNLSSKIAAGESAVGLITGKWSRLSDDSEMLEVYFYDKAGNVAETVTYGPYGHESVTSVQYQLCGNPVATSYTEGDININLQNVYGFANNSLSQTTIELNGVSHSLIANSYDDLGRVTEVRKGNDNHKGCFTYNLRGMLTSICWSDSKINFSQNLYYASGPGTPLYNGSISAMTWKIGKGENRLRGYRYSYNELGWLTEAAYGENSNLQSNTHRYTERVLEYNANGAMKRFQRHGLKDDGIYGKIDNLHISLDGNRISSVTDDAAPVTRYANADFNETDLPGKQFTYDSEGALTSDLNRGVTSISYDDLGNPVAIDFVDGAKTRYVYTPDGEKVRTVHQTPVRASSSEKLSAITASIFDSDTTDYIGSVIYRNGVASSVRYDGGYADLTPGSLTPQFYHYITDYLGNNRGVLRSSDGELVQITHYYPFGAVYADMGMGGDAQPFKFGDKELDMMHGLYQYDYLARSYDPILCVFTRNDNYATKYPHISPRAFCANNPVMNFDPDGNDIVIIGKDNSRITLSTDLIDFSVNVSSLGIDWGGQYVLQGEELLSAALDIAGVFDPSGACDALNASLYAKKGKWWDAGVSMAGVIPFVGDVAKAGRIGKDVKIIKETIESVQKAKSTSSLRRSAVRKAWKDEQQMVINSGHGTREWTNAELKELMETGKVKGYQGHHINNVKHHPELAGNPNNIRFLNRQEHLEAHGGNFRNETHGKLVNRKSY